jgi:hypothetical protein
VDDLLPKASETPPAPEKTPALTFPIGSAAPDPQPTPAVPAEGPQAALAIRFRVQLATSGIAKSETDPSFATVKPVERKVDGKLYKYYSASFPTEAEALAALAIAKKNGFPDAFLVAFRGDQKIPVAEARAAVQPH